MELELIVLSLWIITIITGIADFSAHENQCLGQSVEYQCTVTGSSPTIVLIWRIYNENGTQIGSGDTVYTSSMTSQSIMTIGGVFTVERLSKSPLISNISFTVKSSINGYTIICKDGNTLDIEKFTINILAPPTNISFESIESFVSVSWMPSSSECVSSYSITSNTTNSIITTTDTSVDIPLAGLSPGVYCVSVATVDTANRSGEHSNQECISLEVPLPPGYSYDLSAAESMGNSIVAVLLTFNLSSNVPVVTAGYIIIGSQEFKGKPTNINNNQIHVEFTRALQRGVNYSIVCFGENILGNGSSVTFNIYVNQPTSTYSSVSVTVSPSTSPTPSSSETVYYVVVPIVVIIIIIVVIVIITLVIYLLLKRFKVKSSSNEQTNQVDIDMVNIPSNVEDKNSNLTSLDQENESESTSGMIIINEGVQ